MNSKSSKQPIKPLSGLRVLEIGQFIAVPAAAQILSDLGADVIKLEPPSGDAARHAGWSRDEFGPMFSAYNRGKRSIALDLAQPEQREQARRLALSCDVVLANTRPGALEKVGLGADQLRPDAPRLIYGRVSGFGHSGASSRRPGFDAAAQAESGMMSLNGDPAQDPMRVGFTVVDILASDMLTVGVLAALLQRGLTGTGDLVDVTLIDVAVYALAAPWAQYAQTGKVPLRLGNSQPLVAPAADVITTSQGQIILSAYMPSHFVRLCETIGRPELASDPRFATNEARVANRAALLEELHEAMSHFDAETLVEKLSEGGIVAGVVRTMADVRPGRGGVSSDLFVNVTAAGRSDPMLLPGLPFGLATVAREAGPLPKVGEHTEQILTELGKR